MYEHHVTPFFAHPSVIKMKDDINKQYYWPCMKKDIFDYVEKYLEYQKVKSERIRPIGILHPLEIPSQKWQSISMEFIVRLLRTRFHHDSIFVIMDKLTKLSHFIPSNTNDDTIVIAHKFMKEVFRLHGFPKNIISNRDNNFISEFWQALQKELGNKLNFSSAYNPKIDGKNERVNQILEDTLCITT